MERSLFIAQRISAIVLFPLVLVHLGLMFYAINDGLTALEILERTRGSFLWAGFYSVFVFAVAIHGPIGLRNVLQEWTSLDTLKINLIAVVVAALLLSLGMRAVIAVV